MSSYCRPALRKADGAPPIPDRQSVWRQPKHHGYRSCALMGSQPSQTGKSSVGRYSTACYISDSWPSLLFLAFQYTGKTQAALLATPTLVAKTRIAARYSGVLSAYHATVRSMAWFRQLMDYRPCQSEIAAWLSPFLHWPSFELVPLGRGILVLCSFCSEPGRGSLTRQSVRGLSVACN